ncbi:PE-PGRS family protein PE_PGRS33 [Odontomachus brunneus]|uniref:PE-PGRS family protein PE_PGRS33 n=1 Tax=Odontomachus brunneus TaxID=486640 RepID=UPI0013F22318|nr:PE-PGRS family protein PE_PGRS33 [Odontomachus brunneus]XP_032673612.1 PE-PGRS family protein PE_PGRS33 [Odontomachus brunneus]XP_032673613.1 PE-PGRS family protein PE_PGRS33 [Odontomachus brunneus]XP_032673615.1 PE-PGRS family protein PE_PGRS33 [Odontomachus brunneus]
MRIFCALCGLFLAVAIVNCSPIVKREADKTLKDLDPLNEVYVFEVDDDTDKGENPDREKRKIGLTLGVTNGVINFVFGKLDSLLDAKTKALAVLDDSNRAKNAAFGIDPKHSATSQFISNLVSQKIRAATGSIGPVINSATTLVSGAAAGLANSLVSKVAPLSSLSGGLSGGAGTGGHAGDGGAPAGSAIIGNLLTAGLNTLSTLSQSSGGTSGGTGGSAGSGTSSGSDTGANLGGGINIGGFANLGGNKARTVTTTEDTPVFDRSKVSLEIPSAAFGTSFTLLTNVSKVLNSVIMNSARRTQTVLEVFKPFFRGTFAIKGLPSDNPH